MRIEFENGNVIAFLEGRISSSNAQELQSALSKLRRENAQRELLIDAENLEYISSAGLRVLLTVTKEQGRPLTVRNVSPEVYEIFDMTGFTSILNVRKKLRELSVEGCEIIGRGAIGTVYRVDEDTIVKVYEAPDSIPMIENEQKRAKQAFLKGIPTAISYDVVRVGDKYGSVFEMLKATTYNDMMRNAPERKEELVRAFADFMRQVHAVEMEPGELPDMRDVYKGYLERLRALLPEDLHARLRALIDAMPENLHAIHGDFHLKNIMLDGDQPLLIDMETLSVGDPVFDLQGLFVAYQIFSEDDPGETETFFGISQELADYICEQTIEFYFRGCNAAEIAEAKARCRLVAYVRFLYLINEFGFGSEELTKTRIRHTLELLPALVDTVTALGVAGFTDDAIAR